MHDLPDIKKSYEEAKPRLENLAEVVRFMLDSQFKTAGVKVHTVSSRVKSFESIVGKLSAPGRIGMGLFDLMDLVGLRVVVLFISDLNPISEIVRSEFRILEEDDKVEAAGAESEFGYMSRHFVVELADAVSGPRYDPLKGIQFEIQVRTILMDAWASVSHHLDYKGESSIPQELRRDFHALSGLFYVADKHFEMFFNESLHSLETARQLAPGASGGRKIDLDTVQAFLEVRFPEREQGDRSEVSELVEELTHFGLATVDDVDRLVTGHLDRVLEDEVVDPPSDEDGEPCNYTALGVVRVALRHEVGSDIYSTFVTGRIFDLAHEYGTEEDIAEQQRIRRTRFQ